MWSTSAALTSTAVHAAPWPWVVAVSFSVAALAGSLVAALRGRLRRTFTAPARVWWLGLIGMASYYLAYNAAFSLAPAVEVNLLNYLWPLMTVLLSGPILGSRLSPRTLLAALLGLAGAALVVTQGRSLHLSLEHAGGYALGFWSGMTWGAFSCLLRKYGPVAAGRMPLFCGLTAALGWAIVLSGGGAGQLPPAVAWLPQAIGLGLGPMFAAFQLWDAALQTGDVQKIGVLAYLTPALSTLLLVLFGAPLTRPSLGGLVLILAAAGLGAASIGRNQNVNTEPVAGLDRSATSG